MSRGDIVCGQCHQVISDDEHGTSVTNLYYKLQQDYKEMYDRMLAGNSNLSKKNEYLKQVNKENENYTTLEKEKRIQAEAKVNSLKVQLYAILGSTNTGEGFNPAIIRYREWRERALRAEMKVEELIKEIEHLSQEKDSLKYQNKQYRDRLEIDPGGSDKIDELEDAIEFLRFTNTIENGSKLDKIGELDKKLAAVERTLLIWLSFAPMSISTRAIYELLDIIQVKK